MVVEPATTSIVPVPLPEVVVAVESDALPVGGGGVAALSVVAVVVVSGGVEPLSAGVVVTGVDVSEDEPLAFESPVVVVVTAGGVTV